MDHSIFLPLAASAIGLWMTWGVGANGLANIMGTTMGSKAVSVKQAMIIAIIFEFAGAFWGGSDVTYTISSGIINIQAVGDHQTIAYAMLSVLCASATCISLASFLGMPISITNAIVGSLVGVGAIMLGFHAVHWSVVFMIITSWVASPTIASFLAFVLFSIIRESVLRARDPVRAALISAPFYLFIVGVVLGFIIVTKGLQHFHIHLSLIKNVGLVLSAAFVIVLTGFIIILKMKKQEIYRGFAKFKYIENIFSLLMALTACAMVFAHGANDVAIAVGPIDAIMDLAKTAKVITFNNTEAMILGYIGVVAGLFMYGHKVIATVGRGITRLTPSRAFAATLAAASTIIVSISFGIPVSATQTLVGGVLGVGLARGIEALDIRIVRNIFMSWIISLPASAALATGYFFVLEKFM